MYPFIILSPFLAFALISLFLQSRRRLSAWIATGSILVSFILIAKLFLALFGIGAPPEEIRMTWLALPGLSFEMGILIDRLSILMGLLVSGVGSLIFLYSMGYMEEDPGASRYFAYLALFAASMLGIVFSPNFIQIFVFWELVGLASYLLIGFWFAKDAAADAGKKAFMVNRAGDFGFILGIIFLWFLSDPIGVNRTLDFARLASILPSIPESTLFIAGLLIFCGVVGKSAQFPLHVWLPDAMEGPTPVSALIHAATMVAAGVYLLARAFFLFTLSNELLLVIAVTGALTAFMAASMAVAENDIKRVLAYSTVSQLGFMVLAMGLSGPVSGMYHLLTHGFFKALLFLGAGCLIHTLHTQNLFELGGLAKRMPVTTISFLIGTFALCGLFPTSGFFSKEEILMLAFQKSPVLFTAAITTVFLTSFYMGRLFTLAFLGPERKPGAAHEAPFVMTLPVAILAILSLFGGYFGIPELLGETHHPESSLRITLISSGVVLAGLAGAFLVYGRKLRLEDPLARGLGPVHALLVKKYFMDDLYDFYVLKIQQPVAQFLELTNQWFVIKGLSNLSGEAVFRIGNLTRKLLTGNVQSYAFILVLQIVVVFVVAIVFIEWMK